MARHSMLDRKYVFALASLAFVSGPALAAPVYSAETKAPVFAKTPAAKLKTLYAFLGGASGSDPLAGVIADGAGNFYGTTETDGNGASCLLSGFSGCGVVYRLTQAGSHYTQTVLYSFQGAPNDGALPGFGSLVSDASGALYGTTSSGGSGTCMVSGLSGCGTAFKLTPAGSGYTESVLHSFTGTRDGVRPLGGLIEDATGALYGTTAEGGQGNCSVSGVAGCGTVFKLTPSGSTYIESILYRFRGGKDGAEPLASLIEDTTGALYGTTSEGGGGTACGMGSGTGPTGCGTVFKLTASTRRYTETVLYRFQNPSGGLVPQGSLMFDASGALYGTMIAGGSGPCSASGASGCGTVYKLTPGAGGYSESTIYQFQGAPNDGSSPTAPVLEIGGSFYSTTLLGGNGHCPGEMGAGCGTAFELTPSGSSYRERILHVFGRTAKDGRLPLAGLIAVNGTLYGTTFVGGRGNGTVFQL